MKELAHQILSNTWAVIALLAIGAACMTALLVTHTITVEQAKAAGLALLYGAGVTWMRGTVPPGSVVLPVTAGKDGPSS